LFTVCPKCTLTLVVTTVDLRAGQGYVRCGRCANVFNALIALREGDPNASKSSPSKPPAEPAMGAGVAFEPEPEPNQSPSPRLNRSQNRNRRSSPNPNRVHFRTRSRSTAAR
jgi:predicted Zn finger-like uncharacterized protein